ncbi:SUMF1/EgtB/PvdO family nonheme iron enzyme [Alcaligenaceae bacterium]|nr:SUMF1/EgtB/PvdO family nonheme iron enzyme [Alcaligenaceae bacterium]
MRKPITLTAVTVALLMVGSVTYVALDGGESRSQSDAIELVRVPPGTVTYLPPGEYLRNGMPVSPDRVTRDFENDVVIMKRNVSQAEYAQCVAAKACRALDKGFRDGNAPDKPAVGVSWRDATAYAQWLSDRTGNTYRLPTYAEWAYAAGSAYIEDAILEFDDTTDPAQRWLAEYKLETQRKSDVNPLPQVFGYFGTSSTGLQDIAGNIWDWTMDCHTRQYQDVGSDGQALSGENCGVRVLGGRHISYITDFVRDPKSGACSVGIPPNNLGFRLVQDTGQTTTAAMRLRDRLGI